MAKKQIEKIKPTTAPAKKTVGGGVAPKSKKSK